jgi:Streptomycin adenylyltransferase
MTADEIESRIVAWARRQPDVSALIQIGSRVQPGGHVDAWSDLDFQLFSTNPARYRNTGWLAAIAPCWSTHVERTERGVDKLSVVFAGGHEVDLVLMPSRLMKLVYWAMARPAWRGLYPAMLRRGIADTRVVVRPGYRVVLGGVAWEKRLAAAAAPWPEEAFSSVDFEFHVRGFWRHSVWVQKKIARGEVRAAARWKHVELMDHLLALLAEEARLAGRPARPEARKAEQWLDARRLAQTDIPTSLDQNALARALLAEIELFEEVSRSVAQSRGFALVDHSAVAAWLRAELDKIRAKP